MNILSIIIRILLLFIVFYIFKWLWPYLSSPTASYHLTILLLSLLIILLYQNKNDSKQLKLIFIPLLILIILIYLYNINVLSGYIFVYIIGLLGIFICIITSLLSAYIGHEYSKKIQEIFIFIGLFTPFIASLFQLIVSHYNSIIINNNSGLSFSNNCSNDGVINTANILIGQHEYIFKFPCVNYYLLGIIVSIQASLINILFNKV